MATFGGLVLTNNGRNLFAKAQTGKLLNFKKVVLGDGEIGSSESMINISQLKNQILNCDIVGIQVLQNEIATITFVLNNQELSEGFYWREIGLIAEDPDTQEEILYCYGNARENGEYISAKNEADILEKHINIEIAVSNVENVTAIINKSLVYVDKEELEKAIENINLESNEIYIGKKEGAPDSAKLIIEDDDVEEEEILGNQIQTITNENGTSIKFPDGTMICTGISSNGTYDGSNYTYTSTWVYPANFIDTPHVTGNVLGGNALAYTVLLGVNKEKTIVQTKCLGLNGTVQACDRSASCIAIGRWK